MCAVPCVQAVCLIGEFNNWKPEDHHWAFKNAFGVWELFLADNPDGSSAIPHRTKIKTRLETPDGQWVERIPAWVKWATQVRRVERTRHTTYGSTCSVDHSMRGV